MAYCAYCGAEVREATYAPCPHCGRATNGGPEPSRPIAPPPSGSNAASAVVLIIVGIFVVIGFIGILAAIAIPNLLTAMQRSRQKRTMADLRSLATAVEAYKVDHNALPAGQDVAALQPQLTPTYIKSIPVKDGWDHPLRYDCMPAGQCQSYAIGSGGKDGVFEHDDLSHYKGSGAATNFDCDIVYSDGEFVRYPEGVQH